MKRGLRTAWFLGAVAAGVAWLVGPEHPFDIDAVFLALGVVDFDPASVRPHPPGYPLLVASAKVFGVVFEPLDALRWVARASLAALVPATFVLALSLGARRPLDAALLCAVAPVALAYGAVANAYILGALLGTALLVCALQRRDPLWIGLVFGLACAARPSMLLLAAPMCLSAVGRSGVARWSVGAAAVGVPCLVVTMAYSGGPAAYLSAVAVSWGTAVEYQADRLAQLHLVGLNVVGALAGALLLMPFAWRAVFRLSPHAQRVVGAWAAGFVVLVAWSDGHGYVLLYLPGVLALTVAGEPSRRLWVGAVVVSLLASFAPTLAPPPPCSSLSTVQAEFRYPRILSIDGIRERDARTDAWSRLLSGHGEDGTTLVVEDEIHPALVTHLLPDTVVVRTRDAAPVEGRVLLVTCDVPEDTWRRHEGDAGTVLYERVSGSS